MYIEDVSEVEAQLYIENFVDKTKQSEKQQGNGVKKRNAKNGTSENLLEMPKMAVAYKEEEKEKKENEINVNEHLKNLEQKKRYGMQGLNDILKRFDIQKQGGKKLKYKKQKPEEIQKRDYLSEEIASALGDQKSLGAFRRIAEVVPEGVIREYLANIKETWQEGKIKKSRGALFISLIQQYTESHQLELGFQSAIS